MKQPRVPEYREGENTGGYLKSLVLFLKDFSMAAWKADRQREREIDAVRDSIPAMPEIRYPVTSVNGKTGAVTLDAGNVGALAGSYKDTADSLNRRWNAKVNANMCSNVDNPVETGFFHCNNNTAGTKPSVHGELFHITEDPTWSEHQLFFPSGGGLWHRHRNNNGTPNTQAWGSWQTYKPILDIYPVGAIYMSVNSTSPASLFGGTWMQLKDRFLLGAGGSYAVNAEGGEAMHTLTADQMPVHGGHISGDARPDPAHITNGNAYTGRFVTGTNDKTGNNYGWVLNHGNECYPATLNAGGGAAHNNMPPYLAVYMWKRTA